VYEMQVKAYKQAQESTLSGRDIEAAVLTNAALKLRECQTKWGQNGHEQHLNDALRLNQKIWTIIQSELADESNPLPLNIRQDILNLSIFVDKRIIEVMSYPEPEKLDMIININLNLAAGLRKH
jgi:flagellar biosynthesis activator protein FlaF